MKLLDFSNLTGWPASASTWKFVQEQMLQLQLLSVLGGNTYILSGCAVVGSNTGDGIVVINGEVLPFVGGATQTNVVIIDNVTNRQFFDNSINPYYHERFATFGTATTQYTWADFERNNPVNGILKRMRLAESAITTINTSITTINTSLSNKADKANVLALDNTTAYTPALDYHPATKKYVDDGLGCKLIYIGTLIWSDMSINKELGVLTLTAARMGEGLYRITHSIGNSRYFITAIGKGIGTAHPNAIDRKDNYFDISLSDDASRNDTDFYFQIFSY